jgi:hypothetical protein
MARIAIYNSITAVIIVDGLMLGRSKVGYNSIYTTVKLTQCVDDTAPMYVTSYDFDDIIIMKHLCLVRTDVHVREVPLLPKLANHNMHLCPAVYNATADELQSIMDYIGTSLY